MKVENNTSKKFVEKITVKKWVEERVLLVREADYSEQVEKLSDVRNRVWHELDRKVDALRARQELLRHAMTREINFRAWRVGSLKYFTSASLAKSVLYLISMPFIYGMIVPALIFHLGLEIFHHVSFRLYGIPLVDSRKYFIYDRIHLPYLNWFEKLNCGYCSYFNGLMGYATEIAGRTERQWCPIKHARRRAQEHGQYDSFFEYLDGEKYRNELVQLREYDE